MPARSALILFALLLAGTAAADTSCPSNRMTLRLAVQSSLPADTRTSSVCDPYGCADAEVGYDIPAGFLHASASSSGATGTGGDVLVQDDFKLIGLASGTPASLVIHLDLARSGYFTAHVRDALGNDLAQSGDGSDDSPVNMTLDMATLAGQPFRLQFELVVFNHYIGDGSVSAQFSFTGVPPGAAVVSCNGYVSDHTVPARAMNWGRLKAMYR